VFFLRFGGWRRLQGVRLCLFPLVFGVFSVWVHILVSFSVPSRFLAFGYSIGVAD
jgi:hypothetical protein